ncbi:ligand-gated channel [Bacteroidia bacterium]|nr:ligand-gated channel [Bacteroidia bacterium]
MTKRFSIFTIFQWIAVCVIFAQQPVDSVRLHDLPELQVNASAATISTSLVQTLSAAQLEKLNVLQASDAMKHLSGVQVKDYGGVGGLKTVSIRSLGANYTAVAVDGITVSDYQTGQIDLGRFSLENIESIRLNIGESDNIFQPARNQALGGTIHLVSRRFIPSENKSQTINAGIKTGSWQLFTPFVSYGQKIGKYFNILLFTEHLQSKGNYPYTIGEEERRRINSETEYWQLESRLTGNFGNGGQLDWKVSYYDSDRNLPCPVISINPYAGETMHDRNRFSQINYTQPVGEKFSLLVNAKINDSEMRYADRLYSQNWGHYAQNEYYGSLTFQYQPLENLFVSWANDGSYGLFRRRNEQGELNPSRVEWLSALSAKFENESLTLHLRLLNQQNRMKELNRPYQHLSPCIAGSVRLLRRLPIRLRMSYKNSFRLPTFADIYYPNLPNPGLKPENAHQFNIGGAYTGDFDHILSSLSFSADAYYNRVKNKIMAVPASSLALWSVQNCDEAKMKGVDLNAVLQFRIIGKYTAEIRGAYTFQDVRNGQQQPLRYTPRHIANGLVSFTTPWMDVNYNWIYCGNRYYNETPAPESLLPHYLEQGLALNRMIAFRQFQIRLSAECINLFNVQYDIVRSYPMPGRSFRFGVKFNY